MFALFYGRIVVHALEEKPFRRQRRPSVFAVAAGEDARHGLRRKTPRTGLYNMVRILAGTLCEAGAGRLAPEAVPGILASRDRKNAGPTLAAKGLFLKSADYDTPIE